VAKHPKFSGAAPETSKQPRLGESLKSQGNPIWRVGKIDFDGPWCPKGIPKQLLLEIIGKLKHLESTTWVIIERGGSHFIPVEEITSDARRRLEVLKLDDTDSLFSLRLSARERLWGLRSNDMFSLLWWDPDHQICPSVKKHT
jgi:hypothetical protein